MRRSTIETSPQIEVLEDRYCLSAGAPMGNHPPPHHDHAHHSGHHDHHGPLTVQSGHAKPQRNGPPTEQLPLTSPPNTLTPLQNNVPGPSIAIQPNSSLPQSSNTGNQPKPPPVARALDAPGVTTVEFFAQNNETVPPPIDAGTAAQPMPAHSPEPRTPARLLPIFFSERPIPGGPNLPLATNAVVPASASLPMVTGLSALLPNAFTAESAESPTAMAGAEPGDQTSADLLLADETLLNESIKQMTSFVDHIWSAYSPKTMTWVGTLLAGSLVVLAGCCVWIRYQQMLQKACAANPDQIQWPSDQPFPWEAP